MNTYNIIRQYYIACIVIGGFQFLDGLSFALDMSSPINEAYSYIEMLWVMVSFIFIFVLFNNGRPLFLPLSYLFYISTNIWFASHVFEPIDTTPGYQVPIWFTLITMAFALVIARRALGEYRSLIKNL